MILFQMVKTIYCLFKNILLCSYTAQLNTIPPTVTKNIIEFYSMLEFITKTVASFEKKSFETISKSGREKAVSQLRTKLQLAYDKGNSVLDLIGRELEVQ